MSVFKTTFSRALRVIPTDNADIPYPSDIAVGTNTSVVASSLVDAAADFITKGVATGDVVYNTTDGTVATVVSVVNATTLLLNANIFAATAKAYVVYQASPQTSNGNPGCFLFVGGAGNVRVTTIGQDIVTFNAVPVGTILPVQVVKVHSVASGTTATLINALW
ncbi:MAG: hypothetical protein ACK5DE_04105 [Bacteroidota bacterium]|jgi:hypothetical protein